MSFLRRVGLQYKKTQLTFCHNCLKLIREGKFPKIHFSNGLRLEKVPDELKLKDLEQQLIATATQEPSRTNTFLTTQEISYARSRNLS